MRRVMQEILPRLFLGPVFCLAAGGAVQLEVYVSPCLSTCLCHTALHTVLGPVRVCLKVALEMDGALSFVLAFTRKADTLPLIDLQHKGGDVARFPDELGRM